MVTSMMKRTMNEKEGDGGQTGISWREGWVECKQGEGRLLNVKAWTSKESSLTVEPGGVSENPRQWAASCRSV